MPLSYSDVKKTKNKKKDEDALESLKSKRIKQKLLYPMYKKYCYLEKTIYKYLKNSFSEKDEKLKPTAAARLSMLKALILLGKEKEILAEKIDIQEIRIRKNKKLRKRMEEKKKEAYKELYREVKDKIKQFSYLHNNLKESPKNLSRLEKEKIDAQRELLKGADLYYNEKEDLLTSSDKKEVLKLKEEHNLISGSVVRIYNSFIPTDETGNENNNSDKESKENEKDKEELIDCSSENTENGENLKTYKKNDEIILFKSNGSLFKSTRRDVYYNDFSDTS